MLDTTSVTSSSMTPMTGPAPSLSGIFTGASTLAPPPNAAPVPLQCVLEGSPMTLWRQVLHPSQRSARGLCYLGYIDMEAATVTLMQPFTLNDSGMCKAGFSGHDAPRVFHGTGQIRE